MPRQRSQPQLVKLFEESTQPIYVLDDQRRIVVCNRACAEWLGLTVEQLVGQQCDYGAHETDPVATGAAAALCPPPQAFQGEAATGQVLWRNAAGQIERRPAMFLPLQADESASVLVVLGAIEAEDNSRRDAAENAQSAELHQRLQQLMLRMRTRFRLDQLVGESPAIRRVREQVGAAIASQARVLIVGPQGSGREHVARTIFFADQQGGDRSLLPLDCQAVDVDQLRSLYGGALRAGTVPATSATALLLLNVDQLSPAGQAELSVICRSPNSSRRVLATARKPLVELAAADAYDRDLAFALSTLVVELPALRDRREDIPALAQRLVEEHNASGGRQLAGFSPAALDRLASLPWPGNIDELAAVVREACQTVNTVWIGESDLPARVRAVAAAGLHPRRDPQPIELDAFLLEVEQELIERAMRQAKGNKARAARLLGVSRARLLRRLEQLGLLTREEPVIDFQPEEDS